MTDGHRKADLHLTELPPGFLYQSLWCLRADTVHHVRPGARVAWRNAPKCGNRKFAMELNLLDKRGVKTAEVCQPRFPAALHMLSG